MAPRPCAVIVYSKPMHYLNNNILSISSLLWVNGWLKQLQGPREGLAEEEPGWSADNTCLFFIAVIKDSYIVREGIVRALRMP